jgi:hypothetical protein
VPLPTVNQFLTTSAPSAHLIIITPRVCVTRIRGSGREKKDKTRHQGREARRTDMDESRRTSAALAGEITE